jgi:AcrR family transcriptional regulator
LFDSSNNVRAIRGRGVTPIGAEALERRRARTRAEILDAAWALCREQGLAALSVRDLAARVGLRAPSLYSYFASKDEIYDALFAQGQHQLTEHMDGLLDGPPGRERFRRGAHAFFEFCTADPARYQLLFQRVVPGFVPSPESYALAVANLERLGAELAAAGITDPRHLDLWTALLTGLTDQQLSNDPGGDRWGRLVDEAVDLLCDHAGIDP